LKAPEGPIVSSFAAAEVTGSDADFERAILTTTPPVAGEWVRTRGPISRRMNT